MKKMKLQMFNPEGEVNKVFNDFAEFIFNRKSLSLSIEKKFVSKLETLSGITSSPMSLLEQRINDREIDYKKSIIGRAIINEIKDAIKRHSK